MVNIGLLSRNYFLCDICISRMWKTCFLYITLIYKTCRMRARTHSELFLCEMVNVTLRQSLKEQNTRDTYSCFSTLCVCAFPLWQWILGQLKPWAWLPSAIVPCSGQSPAGDWEEWGCPPERGGEGRKEPAWLPPALKKGGWKRCVTLHGWMEPRSKNGAATVPSRPPSWLNVSRKESGAGLAWSFLCCWSFGCFFFEECKKGERAGINPKSRFSCRVQGSAAGCLLRMHSVDITAQDHSTSKFQSLSRHRMKQSLWQLV